MKKSVELEVKKLIKKYKLSCSVEDFIDKVDFYYVSAEYNNNIFCYLLKNKGDKVDTLDNDYIHDAYLYYGKKILSESFIEEFWDKLDHEFIKEHQKLSQKFLEKHFLDLL